MNDTQSLLGKLLSHDEPRDAIHIAVIPLTAWEHFAPGQHVGPREGEPAAGVVDPFLRRDVRPGEKCWLFLYPNTVTGLRHHWSHPAFARDYAERQEAAQGWMDQYAASLGSSSGEVIMRARDYVKRGNYWSEGGRFESESLPNDFWRHYQTITGETVSEDEQGSFFSCSC